ncbi:hypothetical protein ACFLZ1_01560 [Patescibacteria group bacterium]
MTKRRRLVLESFILTLGFFATQFIDISLRYWAILTLGIVTYFLTAFILKQDLTKIGWIVVLPPTSLYVVSASLFYFLLPQKLLIRTTILALFWIGAYAVLLTQNIYSIASKYKTIQLLRAAQAVGFIITLLTAFFAYNALFSFRAASWINALIIFVFSLPLILSSLWSVVLEQTISSRLITFSLMLSLIIAQMSFSLGFWPLTITTSSLFLVSFLYVSLGIVQSFLSGKLFKNTLREFVQIGVVIFIITFFLARWR